MLEGTFLPVASEISHISSSYGLILPEQICSSSVGSSFWLVCLFVLRFYGPVNPIGSFRARPIYQTTLLLGRLSPLSG